MSDIERRDDLGQWRLVFITEDCRRRGGRWLMKDGSGWESTGYPTLKWATDVLEQLADAAPDFQHRQPNRPCKDALRARMVAMINESGYTVDDIIND